MLYKIFEFIQFQTYVKTLSKNHLNPQSNNISIFSSPRGGSTWLAETLRKIPDSALVWEPLYKYNTYKVNKFNPFAYPEREVLDFAWNQYIPETETWQAAECFFDSLFNKEIVNLKLYRHNNLRKLSSATTFIFKFCFANNLLPWLAKNYSINPILLLRHPCAVVASQLHYGSWDWHKKNFRYDYNMKKFAAFYEPYCDVLDSISCIEERLAAEWAMSVLTPVKNKANDNNWITISYEHMLIDPDDALNKIFKRLPIFKPKDLLKDIEKPVFTKSSFQKKNFDKQLDFWKVSLSPKQIDMILGFIERMGVDFYSINTEPNYSKIYQNEENSDNIFAPDTVLRSIV